MTTFFARIWKALRLPKTFQLNVMRVLQDQFLVGVTGIIFNQNDEVLLFKHTYRQRDWGFPGGYLKAKEHPKEGLEREVKEESGLVISIDTRYKIRTDRDTARLDIVYIGTFIGGEFTPSAEVTEANFFAFDALPLLRTTDLLLLEKVLAVRKEQRVNTHTPVDIQN